MFRGGRCVVRTLDLGRFSPGLSGFGLDGCELEGLELELERLVLDLGLDFRGLDLVGLDLVRFEVNGAGLDALGACRFEIGGLELDSLYLDGLDLDGLDLDGLDLGGLRLDGLDLDGLNLGGLRLDGLDLDGLNLGGLGLRHVLVDPPRFVAQGRGRQRCVPRSIGLALGGDVGEGKLGRGGRCWFPGRSDGRPPGLSIRFGLADGGGRLGAVVGVKGSEIILSEHGVDDGGDRSRVSVAGEHAVLVGPFGRTGRVVGR